MKFKSKLFFKENTVKTIPFVAALFISFVSLRIYEYLNYSEISENESIKTAYLFGGILIDLLFSNFIYFLASCILGLLFFRKIKKTFWFHIVAILAIFSNYALIQVFFNTREPLDSMVFNFDWEEINTITSGESPIGKTILEITVIYAIFLLTFFLFKRAKLSVRASKILFFTSLFLVCLSPLIDYSSNKHIATKLVSNKLAFFSISCIEYILNNTSTNSNLSIDPNFIAGKQIDENFPFLHEFEIQEEFANLFKDENKNPPNLVFIIVESLSTKFVGKYGKNTLKLTPFLDSLSEKSIYFPHIVATAERTFGVLPAILASTPNAPKNEYLMNMDFPNLHSLPQILKNTYFSRFYCGVYLEFHNMKNFMHFIKTDYLVQNWENQFQDDFFKNNSWGHPDNQLFEKVLLDNQKIHKEIKKPKLDIILTVSTHGPFQIPNQEKYKKDLLADLKSKKIKTNYHSVVKKNLVAFSTYRYTDENLKKYFAQIKNNPAYKNTIFFIVGDHGSEVHSENELTKLVVPLFIVSDLIKKPQKFETLSSHLDILPSVLSLLHENYGIEVPKKVAFMGKGLRLKNQLKSDLHQAVATINYKNDILLYKNNYLYYNQLFQIQKNLKLKPILNEKVTNDLKKKLKRYDEISYYCYKQNKLINSEATINDLVIKPIINSKEEFITIVKEYNFKEKMSNFKIEITFDYYLNKEKDIKHIPSYITTLNLRDSMINWKGTQAKLNQKFKKGWNQMKYTIMLDESILQNKTNLNLGHYIYNSKKRIIKMKNVKYKSYKNI